MSTRIEGDAGAPMRRSGLFRGSEFTMNLVCSAPLRNITRRPPSAWRFTC